MSIIRDRSQTLPGGPDAKKGPLKFVTHVRGASPKKITTNFPAKIEFTYFSMRLTPNFCDKKGGALKFFEV